MFSRRLTGTGKVCVIAALAVLCLASAAFLAVVRSVRNTDAGSFQALKASYRPSDAVLLDRHGEVIHTLRTDDSGRRLEWARIADVSPSFLATVVLVERPSFLQSSMASTLLHFVAALVERAAGEDSAVRAPSRCRCLRWWTGA
jgi:penicillin-binding protein 1C